MSEWELAQQVAGRRPQATAEGATGEWKPHVPEGLAWLVWGAIRRALAVRGVGGPQEVRLPLCLGAEGAPSCSKLGRDLGLEDQSAHVTP